MVPTGASISVSFAVALRACKAACRRVKDNGSLGAGLKNLKFPGVLPAQPAGRKKSKKHAESDRIKIRS